MSYFIPSPADRNALSRSLRILDDAPQAARVLRAIDEAADDLSFGSPISAFLNDYHFPAQSEVKDFFSVYLAQSRNAPTDEANLRYHLVNTINRRPPGVPDSEDGTRRTFHGIFEELHRQIEANAVENIPLVNFIVGPTGAGKTAFSKGLFTVCQERFWSNRIVPSRVEFSKFGKANVGAHSESYARDPEFLSFVRRCQLRDLLIYFCSSGQVDRDAKRKIIAKLSLSDSRPQIILQNLVDQTDGIIIDGKAHVLNSSIRRIFEKAVRDLGAQRDSVLYEVTKQLAVRYLVSFDGFDSTKLEHFLFERKRNVPITLIAQMVKGLHEKVVHPEMDICPLESHYLVYLRDTTFAGLKTQIFSSVGGSITYPVYWIVPPSYSALVHNVAAHLTGSRDRLSNQADDLFDDIISEFNEHIFDVLDLDAEKHLPFVFGSSGRRMKSHIRNQLISAVSRVREQQDLRRTRSGIDGKTVWDELVTHRVIKKIPYYMILEDLFLNDARQLIPRLELDAGKVTALLNRDDFTTLIEEVEDTDESSGMFGCLFNYFYRTTIASENDRQPAMLLLIRIHQYVLRNPRCNANEVHEFLKAIGYDVPKQVSDFALCVIIRSEAVKWDSTTGARSIDDVPLFATVTGKIALEKLLYSVSYLSEAILSSIQIDRHLTDALRERVPNNAVWIADCIHNASIALYIIGQIEKIEAARAKENNIGLAAYLLYDRLRKKLESETRHILQANIRSTNERWEKNRTRLNALKERYPGLVILGGDVGPR
jgi:hypothetical protein